MAWRISSWRRSIRKTEIRNSELGMRLSEAHAAGFRSEQRDDERNDEHDGHQPAHRLRVREALAERRLHVGNACREHHAKLIREAGEESAQMVRGELVDVGRNHTPRSLYEELHQEHAEQDPNRAVTGDPERYDD